MSRWHKALFAELQKDHREIVLLLSRLQETTDPSQRHRMVEDLLREILPHMIAEEQVVYPALGSDPQGRKDALHFVAQHRAAQEHLEELAATSPADVRFRPRAERVSREIRFHIQTEEETIFTDLERIVPEREARRLLEDFRRERDLARRKYPDLPIRTDERDFRI